MEWMRNVRRRLRRLCLLLKSAGFLRSRGRIEDRETAKKKKLERDLWEAHREWEIARMRLDEALGTDEVDYAVLTLEAAEKRYDMLLRKAKELGLERTEWRLAPAATRSNPRAHRRKEETGWSRDG